VTNTQDVLSNFATGGPFTEKDCYDALVDIEGWLERCIKEVVPTPALQKGKVGKGRLRKTIMSTTTQARIAPSCACAEEVVAYGDKRGWITLNRI
jgi:serine/threonine-protein kinase haspin